LQPVEQPFEADGVGELGSKQQRGMMTQDAECQDFSCNAGLTVMVVDYSEWNVVANLLEDDQTGAGWCSIFHAPCRVSGVSIYY
jgi:hypothetical protein